MFRNRFLNSASFLFNREDGAGQGGEQGNDQGQNSGDSAGDVTAQAGKDGGNAEGAGGEGEGDGGDDAGGAEGDDGAAGAGGEDGSDDEDDPYAGLTPEQRDRIERAHQREIGWRDRQLARATGKRRAAEAEVRTAGAVIDRQQRAAPVAGADGEELVPKTEVQRAAQQLRAQEEYDTACNNTDAAGRRAFKDKWASTTDKLGKMGGIAADDMADIVLGTDHPEMVLHSLAQDPDLYDRVMNLPPAKRRSEFVKLGLKEPPKAADTGKPSKRPGDTPPPPRTLNGSRHTAQAAQVDLYKDNTDDDAWYKARNETRRKKFTNVQ